MQTNLPVLYSFRRCPYAMRARMALHVAEIAVEHREILLKNKPPSMLLASTKGTVPVLVLQNGDVIDESWDVMRWALQKNDPENWLGDQHSLLDQTQDLVRECDGSFKQALDHYKYSDRHPLSPETYREQGLVFLTKLEMLLAKRGFLLGPHRSIADIALMPFVRQFAHVDKEWFSECGLNHLNDWLTRLLNSALFKEIMVKHPLWEFKPE